MTQNSLNNLMVLHIHKDSTDSLDLMNIAQDFVAGREGRLSVWRLSTITFIYLLTYLSIC